MLNDISLPLKENTSWVIFCFKNLDHTRDKMRHVQRVSGLILTVLLQCTKWFAPTEIRGNLENLLGEIQWWYSAYLKKLLPRRLTYI